MQHQIAVKSLKKLSNPRLRPETRRKLIWDVIVDEKLCYDLTTYPCFENFPRRDKVLILRHVGPYYLYHTMNNTYHRGGDLKTVKLALFFLARNQITHMYFKYIISDFGKVKTILDNEELKTLFFKLIIKYRIVDIQTFLLEVWDAIDAISDMTQGISFDIVKERTWDELHTLDLKPLVTRKARLEAKRWGIEIETVTLSDLAKIRSIRLLNDNGSVG